MLRNAVSLDDQPRFRITHLTRASNTAGGEEAGGMKGAKKSLRDPGQRQGGSGSNTAREQMDPKVESLL